jgi:hypothetical protein
MIYNSGTDVKRKKEVEVQGRKRISNSTHISKTALSFNSTSQKDCREESQDEN